MWVAFPLVHLIVQLIWHQEYGIFRDEFYYLACSDRLAWGYVDHPPLSIAVLHLVREIFGDSLLAIRLVPALAGSATIFLVGYMTRLLGGNRPAQVLAMTAALAAPAYLALHHFYSMNALDILFWTASMTLIIRILNGAGGRSWIALGVVLGLGLLNKISVLWLGFGFLVGLVLTPARRFLRTPMPWITGSLALVMFLPHILWQISYDWPTLEFIHNATTQKMKSISPWDFFAEQILVMNPISLPIWISGLVFFFGLRKGRETRLLGWMFVTICTILLISGSARSSYLAPAYTVLFAAGSVAITDWIEGFRWPSVGWILPVLVLAAGGFLAPLAIPVLPVQAYITYAQKLGIQPDTAENKEIGALPQHFADMHGWRDIFDATYEVVKQLSPEERSRTCILALNYGVAGALEYFGKERPLPPIVSNHNSYWFWGRDTDWPEIWIILGSTQDRLVGVFEDVSRAATIECGYCMPYENNRPIWICRHPKTDLDELWLEIKNFN